MVDAAEGLYRDCGWDLLTIGEVARRARSSRALVYIHFGDKAGLHLAIVERALALLHRRFRSAARSHPGGLDRLDAMARAFAALACEKPHYFDACSRFHAARPAGGGRAAGEHACLLRICAILETLEAAVAAGYFDGSLRPDLGSPRLVAIGLWAFMHGSVQVARMKMARLTGRAMSDRDLIDHARALVRRMLQSSSTTS